MFNFLRIASVAAKALGAIIQLVPIVEGLKQAGQIASSADARARVIDSAMGALLTAEGTAGRDLLNDQEVRAVVGDIVDLVVRFHNLVARKAPVAA